MGDDYKALGLLAAVLLFAGLMFIVVRWPKNRHATFSQHVALRKQSIIYYIVLFSIVLPLLALFFLKWFMPAFGLSVWFGVLIIISSIAQYLCVLIPEVDGWKSSIHRFFAGVSAILLVPALALLFFSGQISALDTLIAGAGMTAMLITIFIVVAKKGQPQNFLMLQAVYFAAFFVPILVVGYL